MADRTWFARLATDAVVRRPRLWTLFRRPLTRMFDGLAPTWEESRISPVHLAALDAALDRIDDPPARILDVGTGTGVAARALAARWPDAAVTGVDVSPEMLRVAQERAVRERYLHADGSTLPFADDSFDLVVLMNMIPFYDELARVLAPGGTLVLAYSRGADTPIFVSFARSRDELGKRGFDHFEEAAGGTGSALVARLHFRGAAR